MKKILIGFIAIGLLTFVGCGKSSSVKIGEQEWMSQNLNVDHFRNGDIIPEVKTKEEWVKAGEENQPAWCYYENNPSNGEKYGKLYNCYAVSDPRGLAPDGWHIPADAEWTVLTDYLTANGHDGTEGIALKATSGWNDYNGQSGNGTDNYGWNGLPGGIRGSNGNFNNIGGYGYWWSSSQHNSNNAWNRSIGESYDEVDRSFNLKDYGFSVRCLRD